MARASALYKPGRISNPPAGLSYEPQRDKASSVFFWSQEAIDFDKELNERGDYPPPLPKFVSQENRQISKVCAGITHEKWGRGG